MKCCKGAEPYTVFIATLYKRIILSIKRILITMSVSISTSVYTKQITAEIDGVEFKVTPMSSAQTLSYVDLCDELKEAKSTNDPTRVKEAIRNLNDILFSVFDKPDEARKVLAKVPIEGVLEIYQKIVGEKPDNQE